MIMFLKHPCLLVIYFQKGIGRIAKILFETFWKIANYDTPHGDYILSSGKSYAIKNDGIAFEVVNIKLEWIIDDDEPLKTKALYNNPLIVKINKNYYRENDEKEIL